MIDVHLSMDPKTRQSISSVAYIISYAETNSKAYNLTKSLIKKVFFWRGGRGCKAIWRIVRTSEKILATPLILQLDHFMVRPFHSTSKHGVEIIATGSEHNAMS